MSSIAQINANRKNAAASTGPKTPEGIAACKHNATRHGLTSQQIVIKGEDPAAYDELRANLIVQHAPATELEAMLVEQMAQNWWRLKRGRRIESSMLEQFGEVEAYSNKAYLNLQRQLTTTERAWNRAVRDLQKLQAYRRQVEREEAKVRAASAWVGSVIAEPVLRFPTRAAQALPATDAALTDV